MNLIHTKLRNKLCIEKASKLIYIYMNQRVLDRNGDIFVGDSGEKSLEEQPACSKMFVCYIKRDGFR